MHQSAYAQASLPNFTVRELGKGKIQISWLNQYPSCIQLSIQRSTDSSKNFRTIFSSLSPELPANGYVDNKLPQKDTIYYRLFYVLNGGAYYFSNVSAIRITKNTSTLNQPDFIKKVMPGPPIAVANKVVKEGTRIIIDKNEVSLLTIEEYKAFKDSINNKTNDALRRINEHTVEWILSEKKPKKELIYIFKKGGLPITISKQAYAGFKDSIFNKTSDTLTAFGNWHKLWRPYVEKTEEFIQIYRYDSLLSEISFLQYKKFRDSIISATKDTIYMLNKYRADIHPFMPKYVWRPSTYVYTNQSGYVKISLPLHKQHRYHLIFFEEDGTEIFRIKTIKESELILDKTNFMHAGWFYFELYENDKLKEKNKFQLQKN